MPYDKNHLTALRNEFDLWSKKIKNASQDETAEEKKNKIIESYNRIIKYLKETVYDVSKNDDFKLAVTNYLKHLRVEITSDLKTLNYDIEVPTNLTKTIEIAKEQNSSENDKNNEHKESEDEDILVGSTHLQNEILNALVDEFNTWHKKINRKNASEDEEKVKQRTV